MTTFAEPIRMAARAATFGLTGTISRVSGLTVYVRDFPATIGSLCTIRTRSGDMVPGEVIGFDQQQTLVMPFDELSGIACGDKVNFDGQSSQVPVGDNLLGRVVDGMIRPIDDRGPLRTTGCYDLSRPAPRATERPRIVDPLGTGVAAIDALLTCGRGQRLGIFSGPGVGKSILLGMIARYTAADVIVIALVGERGKEVADFLSRDLGEEGLARSVVVVSTSDQSPALRVRASMAATSVAEYFRDQGKDVLLLMDSLTRLAMAQRQIGLAAGEPPATKGYTPSVFAMLPKLLERSGRNRKGSITGFYSVLVEGDDMTEPVSDTVRGILDGHVTLDRQLAQKGHFPAISILESVSRVMTDVVDDEHNQAARLIKRLTAIYQSIEDLVNIGAYAQGSNVEYDLAVKMYPRIEQFLRQDMHRGVEFGQARQMVCSLAAQAQQEQQNATAQQNNARVAAGASGSKTIR